jgi:hypothetical protein
MQMDKYSGVISAFVFILIICHVNLAAKNENKYEKYLKQGVAYLDKNNPDSAIAYFVKSFSEGLSKDSLFYFWAEALMQKGVLDSALAANFMIGRHNDKFAIRTMMQRHALFSKLGWEKEADNIRDTIHALRQYRKILLVPDIDMGMNMGYNIENKVSDTSSPWGKGWEKSLDTTENALSVIADIKSTWRIRNKKSTIGFGIGGTAYKKTYDVSFENQSMDSSGLIGSIFASVSGKTVSSSYSLFLNRRIDDSIFIGNSLDAAWIGKGSMMPLLWLGGQINTTKGGKFADSRLWLFASAMHLINSRTYLSYQCFFNVMFDRTSMWNFTMDTIHIIYSDNASQQYPVFYTDSTYSSIIDTSLLRVITGTLRNDIIASGRDTSINVLLKQPNSNIMLNPKVSLTVKTFFPLQFSLGWKLNYFWEPYEWDQIKINADYFVYSRIDGKYYIIPVDPAMDDFVITYGSNGGLTVSPAIVSGTAVVHHSKTRIDNSAVAEFSVQMLSGKTGSLNLRTSFTKTWSTLARSAPIEIPSWSLSANLEWRFKIPNKFNVL